MYSRRQGTALDDVGRVVRVLYFTRDYSPHDHRFLTALTDTNYEVYLLRLEKKAHQGNYLAVPRRVQPISWPGDEDDFELRDAWKWARKLRKILLDVKPDVVHAGPLQKAAFLTSLTDFHPLVSMSWGSDLLKDAESSGQMRQITRRTLDRTDVLLADCQAVLDKAVALGFPRERIVVFPWGVDLELFAPGSAVDFRRELGWEDAFIVLSSRSWEPLYGVDVLLRGFIKAALEIPDLRLIMLGNGSQTGILHGILKDSGVEGRVYFGGQVNSEKLADFYRASDLYISASQSDGSSVSLMEAMASGLPVLVSDIPGNREWVTPGEQGWLFPTSDDQAICDGIIRAYKKQDTLEKMSTAARTKAEMDADWSKNFPRLLGAYDMAVRLRGAEHA
jgi:glycosyltransferase involved in cell wall biosynthesis